MSRLVIDCSVSAVWCLTDESSEVADKILKLLANDEAIVPSLWITEMANVLVTAERRGRITPADSTRALELLQNLPIRIDSADIMTLNACRLLAREHDLSAYDAAYLELAQRAGLPLATMDHSLAAAARRSGVPLLPTLGQ